MHCRVGIELPTIEVRYEQLNVEADVIAAGRALPTLWNAATNLFEVSISNYYIFSLKKKLKI